MKLIDEDDREISEINMTPFVDIILVVLIIFLATATFIVEGKIPLNLPKAKSGETGEYKGKKVVITIKKDGTVIIDKKKVSIEELKSSLSNFGKNITVIIRADRDVPFQKVVTVIDVCRLKGFEKYSIETTNLE